MAVRHCDVAANSRGRKRSRYLYVRVRPRGERIVSREQHAIGFQLQIESRFGQFRKRDAAAHSKMTASQIAHEAIQGKRVLRKAYARTEIRHRRESRIRKTCH